MAKWDIPPSMAESVRVAVGYLTISVSRREDQPQSHAEYLADLAEEMGQARADSYLRSGLASVGYVLLAGLVTPDGREPIEVLRALVAEFGVSTAGLTAD